MTHMKPILLKTDPLLGLYACVDAGTAKRLRKRLPKMYIRFTVNPEEAAHLLEPDKIVLAFGREHPIVVRDAIATRDMAAELDSAVVLPETTYGPPLDQFLSIGEELPGSEDATYAQLGIGHEHVPELIRMATDDGLNGGPGGSKICWAPVHAWWALSELRAEEAIAPLLGLLRRVDEEQDDWVEEDIPEVLADIGPAALEPTAAYLADPNHGDWARVSAARAIELIGNRYPDEYDECVSLLTAQLERYETQSPTLNGFLISPLLELFAVESAPIMERAFAAGRVDEEVAGDWEDVQIEFGLMDIREHERKPTKLMKIGAKLRALWPAKKPKAPLPFPPAHACMQPAKSDKIGRNEPCPCGSGRKFKKCCGK